MGPTQDQDHLRGSLTRATFAVNARGVFLGSREAADLIARRPVPHLDGVVSPGRDEMLAVGRVRDEEHHLTVPQLRRPHLGDGAFG